jgi:predicted transport protein
MAYPKGNWQCPYCGGRQGLCTCPQQSQQSQNYLSPQQIQWFASRHVTIGNQALRIDELKNEINRLKDEIQKKPKEKKMSFWFRSKALSDLRMELAELTHKHKLELEEKKASFDREKKNWVEDKERLVKKMTDEHEIKLKEAVSLANLESMQKIKQAQLDAERAFNEKVGTLNSEHYDKLSAAMTKLHEEGNVTTKFTQELALKMFNQAPKLNTAARRPKS